MGYKFIRLKNEDKRIFKQLAQESFQKGYEDEFGKDEDMVLPEEDIDMSLNAEGAVSYVVLESDEIIGGAIVNINSETNHNHLGILFVKNGVQSKGVGMYIWNEIETLYPDTKIWETYTPYFEKRNIHFYVNKCGFRVVEFFNPRHPAEWNRNENETGNIPNEPGQYFFRFQKVME